MSDFIAAFHAVIAFVIAAVIFIICASILSSKKLKKKRQALELPYREIISIIEKFPAYGPKDTVYFFDKDKVRPRAMNYESAKHFLEQEAEKRKAERERAFRKKGPDGSGDEIIRADRAIKAMWSLENDERRYRKALAELNSWTEKYAERLDECASGAVKRSLGCIYNIIEDAYETGNFLSIDGDQSQNRLKSAEKELVESMESDIRMTFECKW